MTLPGPLLTRWTIRLALLCYVVYVANQLAGNRRQAPICKLVWTLGCVLFTIHVACAFHFYHHWSHAAAWQNTAERTAEMLGRAFGDGIYFSYAFLVLWWIDVLWLLLESASSKPAARASDFAAFKSASVAESNVPPSTAPCSATNVPAISAGGKVMPAWRLALHAFLFFIVFNGAIVFEAGPTRYAAIAACLLLGGLILHSARRRKMLQRDQA
jgi:hypothetical protein